MWYGRMVYGNPVDRPSFFSSPGSETDRTLLPLLEPLMRRLISTPFWKRGLIYMLCIYLGEYTSGILLRYKNACPWNYEKSPFHIQRVIRLDFAPLWFCAGLFFERLLMHSDS